MPRQIGRNLADDIYTFIILYKIFVIYIHWKICYQFLNWHKWAVVQAMAWRPIDDKPLPEPMTILFTETYMRHPASMS